ncbi:MAG: type II toxin-antitoxin system Phd/YefM family antitoxin [candidate division Zixibacteria bacterium]|nr:type II toxin-antitoxin system Phd/YefM family antitoxin [Candidatus Tariuqbacter arcticus]
MITLNPNILEKDGKKEFVVLSYEEFLQVQEELENYEDLKELRSAKIKEADALAIPLAEVRKLLGV